MTGIFCVCIDERYRPPPILELWPDTWLCITCTGRFDEETEGYPASMFVTDLGIDCLSMIRPDAHTQEDVE